MQVYDRNKPTLGIETPESSHQNQILETSTTFKDPDQSKTALEIASTEQPNCLKTLGLNGENITNQPDEIQNQTNPNTLEALTEAVRQSITINLDDDSKIGQTQQGFGYSGRF